MMAAKIIKKSHFISICKAKTPTDKLGFFKITDKYRHQNDFDKVLCQ